MKKIKLLLLAAAPLIFGCSGDDAMTNIPVSTTPQYIKKITETISYGSAPDEQYVYDFTYDGSKLTEITVGNDVSIFSYDGNKITAATQTENGLPDGTKTYRYSGDQLDYIVRDDESAERTNFQYSNGHLAGTTSSYSSGFESVTLETDSFTFQNGNIVQWYQESHLGSTVSTSRRNYTYDNHPNPLRDMNPYLKMSFRTEGLDGLNVNNPVSEQSFYPADSTTFSTYTYNMIYDSAGFPVQIIRRDADGRLISQTDIEYR